MFCDVEVEHVLSCVDSPSIYQVPLSLFDQEFDVQVLKRMNLTAPEADLSPLKNFLAAADACEGEVHIAIVGKYVELHDAYLSIVESLHHAGIHSGANVSIRWVNSEDVEETGVEKALAGIDGIIVPGGFGTRGVEGKIMAVQYARENKIPFLGICLGMHCTVIEFARNVLGLKDANTSEINENTPDPVIDIMPDQKNIDNLGGTMRLGAYPCKLAENTWSRELYGDAEISERHRHRYEFNNSYREAMTKAGLVFAGTSPDDRLVEIVELPKDVHPYFVSVQFHPEFKSRPNRPHPLFKGLVTAAAKNK